MPKTIGLLGKKIGMTRVFSESGAAVGVTVIESGPCIVLQKKTKAREGYNAIQIGFERKSIDSLSKPMQGHVKKAGSEGYYYIREFRVADPNNYEIGQKMRIGDLFKVGDLIDISGNTKGRGFQGVVKRHGFRGGRKTHGSMFHRAPGSIGCSAFPSRVIKGKKLPGQMGNTRMTKKNCMVVDIRVDENLLIVKGGVPGPRNGILQIYSKFVRI